MSRLRLLFACVAEAVCRKGLKALASLVPFGDAVYEISIETWDLFVKRCQEEAAMKAAQPEPIPAALRADFRGRPGFNADVQPRGQRGRPGGGRQPAARRAAALRSYLAQLPGTIRRSLRRPSDPTGTTVPAGMPLSKPNTCCRSCQRVSRAHARGQDGRQLAARRAARHRRLRRGLEGRAPAAS
jgi:hypothetical protein